MTQGGVIMTAMKFAGVMAVLVGLSVGAAAAAEPVYSPSPSWQSLPMAERHGYSTGGQLVDLNRDGWLDFVVANGNDIEQDNLVVYYNTGAGTLATTPGYLSSDNEYNGHLSVADVNGDGWLDVAVGMTMATDGKPAARLYLNNAGSLTPLPAWTAATSQAAFHVAFGDVNGDGRPDLAVGTGWPYGSSPPQWNNLVYLNQNGALATTPSWVSSDTRAYMDALFCDVDRDGWQDLVGVGGNDRTYVYPNAAGTLATTASWWTTYNPNQFGLLATYGDLDGDGWFELLQADNLQLFSGTGEFHLYSGLPGGLFTTNPTWTYYDVYASAVALADVDADGDLDLATGAWFGQVRYFTNDAGTLSATPTWTGAPTGVAEAICFGDVNNDGRRWRTEGFGPAWAGTHLFHLAHQPIEAIDFVIVDGVRLDPGQFTYDTVHGWISVGPAPTRSVQVRYAYSLKPDMAVTHWSYNYPNRLYLNDNGVRRFGDDNDDDLVNLADFPPLVGCLTGPGPIAPPPSADCLEVFDTDRDGDVDLVDWSEWTIAFTG